MKVLVSLLSAALLAAQPVFANDLEVYADPEAQAPETISEIFEIDEGAMSVLDLQAVQSGTDLFSLDPAKKKGGGNNNGGGFEGSDLVGVIIGGIIGAIGAGIIEKDHRYKSRQVTCYAKNGRGNVFRAQGKRPRAVQARAMDKCYRDSFRCRELGCRVN
jgi:hypothetical protein